MAAFVCAFDSKFYKAGVNHIASIHRIYPKSPIFVYNLGLSDYEKTQLSYLRNIHLVELPVEKPKDPYAWKLYILADCSRLADCCLYLDCGFALRTTIDEVFQRIHTQGSFILEDSSHVLGDSIDEDFCQMMKVTDEEKTGVPIIFGGIHGMKSNSLVIDSLYKTALRIYESNPSILQSRNDTFVTFANKTRVTPPIFKYDQALLSLILARMDTTEKHHVYIERNVAKYAAFNVGIEDFHICSLILHWGSLENFDGLLVDNRNLWNPVFGPINIREMYFYVRNTTTIHDMIGTLLSSSSSSSSEADILAFSETVDIRRTLSSASSVQQVWKPLESITKHVFFHNHYHLIGFFDAYREEEFPVLLGILVQSLYHLHEKGYILLGMTLKENKDNGNRRAMEWMYQIPGVHMETLPYGHGWCIFSFSCPQEMKNMIPMDKWIQMPPKTVTCKPMKWL